MAGLEGVETDNAQAEWRLDTEPGGHWRWKLVGANGWPLAISPFNYDNRPDAVAAIERVCTLCEGTKIIDTTRRS